MYCYSRFMIRNCHIICIYDTSTVDYYIDNKSLILIRLILLDWLTQRANRSRWVQTWNKFEIVWFGNVYMILNSQIPSVETI